VDSGKMPLGFPPSFFAKAKMGGTDAYSGATAAEFNRVPVCLSRNTKLQDLQLGYILFKEQSFKFLPICLILFKQKIKKFNVLDK
jgi:hypothetical protein